MRNLLLIALIITYCMSCRNSKTISKSGKSSDSTFVYNDRFIKIDSSTKADFEKYSEFDFKKTLDVSHIIKVNKDTLKFVIDSLRSVIFTDTLNNTDNVDLRKNEHLGNLLDYYVIQEHLYETSRSYLVNKNNGLKYEMISDPYISPNKKYILSLWASLEYSSMPTGIQVWDIKKDKLVMRFDLDLNPKGFEIQEIRWITNDKLAVKIGFGNDKNAYGIMTIK